MFLGKIMAKGKVPVILVTGRLGSGKTSLLNHILSSLDHKLHFAIFPNEFGSCACNLIDHHGVAKEIVLNEDAIEVRNGCLRCSVRGEDDLATALKRLHAKITKFDGVIIETAGMTDRVAQTFFALEEVASKYSLDSIVTLVDASHAFQCTTKEDIMVGRLSVS